MNGEKAAAALLQSAQGGERPSPAIAEGLDPASAYAVQDALMELYQKQETGAVGYKVALTSGGLMEKFSVSEPVYGRILSNACYADGKELRIPNEMTLRVECELALVLKRDVSVLPTDRAELLSCVAYVLPALEVTASRYCEPHTSAACLIADNANFHAAVLGDVPVDLNGLESDLLGLRLEVNGKLRLSGVSAAVMEDPLNSLSWLIEELLSQGKYLRKGDIVLTGAIAQAEPAKSGDHFCAEIDGVGRVSALFL